MNDHTDPTSDPNSEDHEPATQHDPGRDPAAPEGKSSDPASFPIVGVGASAGGVQALETLFSKIPEGCQAAFVVVQHLDPNYKSIMDSLLGKQTKMPVVIAEEGTQVSPGCVYLKPSGQDLVIADHVLHLLAANGHGYSHLPIDRFLRSLALANHDQAVAVLLSGASNDGTLGAKAVKGEGGWSSSRTRRRPNTPRCPAV